MSLCVRARSAIAAVSLLVASTVVFSACSVSVSDGKDGWPGTGGGNNGVYSGALKPDPTDFTGQLANFAGTWKGDCAYVMNGDLRTDCTATLNLQFVSQMGQTAMMGSLSYQIGSTTYPAAEIRPFMIDAAHNTMKSGDGAQGQIGKRAFQFLDGTFGGFSARLLGSNQIGVLASRLPTSSGFDFASTQYDCSRDYCFSATLRLQ